MSKSVIIIKEISDEAAEAATKWAATLNAEDFKHLTNYTDIAAQKAAEVGANEILKFGALGAGVTIGLGATAAGFGFMMKKLEDRKITKLVEEPNEEN